MMGAFFTQAANVPMLQSGQQLLPAGRIRQNQIKRDFVHIAKNRKNFNRLRAAHPSFRDICTKSIETSVQLQVLKFLPSMVLPA